MSRSKVSIRDIAAGRLPEILQSQLVQQLTESARTGNVATVRKLLKMNGVDVNAANTNGDTALICAATNGEVEVVKLIMDKLGLEGIEITSWDFHLLPCN